MVFLAMVLVGKVSIMVISLQMEIAGRIIRGEQTASWSSFDIFNRSGVAGAVLQTPLLLINSVSQSSFPSKSSKHLHSQAETILTTPCVSCVICRVSHVMRQVSGVMCYFFYLKKKSNKDLNKILY